MFLSRTLGSITLILTNSLLVYNFFLCIIITSLCQCKETEENIRMGKIRDLFKKIRDTKGIFHGKMGTIKDRNGMDLKKRWQEYTQELYKKDLHDPANHDSVITHLELYILDFEVNGP